tara:strand:+ start:13974 stop:14894 length:921 start_codon:yes stop_codon:yes gene_type:complete
MSGSACDVRRAIGRAVRLIPRIPGTNARIQDFELAEWLHDVEISEDPNDYGWSGAKTTAAGFSNFVSKLQERGSGSKEFAAALYYRLHYHVEKLDYANEVDRKAFNGQTFEEFNGGVPAFSAVPELGQGLIQPSLLPLSRLINRDANMTNGEVIVDKAKSLGAVTRRSEARPDRQKILSTSDWFRIEFSGALKNGNSVGLQENRRNWSFLSTAQRFGEAVILLPGLDESGRLDWMQEREWTGINRFILIETLAPLPSQMQFAYQSDLPLDSNFLQSIANFYELQDPSARRISVVVLEIQSQPSAKP